MPPLRYSAKITDKYPELYNFRLDNLWETIISYLIDSKYRTAAVASLTKIIIKEFECEQHILLKIRLSDLNHTEKYWCMGCHKGVTC